MLRYKGKSRTILQSYQLIMRLILENFIVMCVHLCLRKINNKKNYEKI